MPRISPKASHARHREGAVARDSMVFAQFPKPIARRSRRGSGTRDPHADAVRVALRHALRRVACGHRYVHRRGRCVFRATPRVRECAGRRGRPRCGAKQGAERRQGRRGNPSVDIGRAAIMLAGVHRRAVCRRGTALQLRAQFGAVGVLMSLDRMLHGGFQQFVVRSRQKSRPSNSSRWETRGNRCSGET